MPQFFGRLTHLKFNSSPLKSYLNPIGKDRLPTTIFQGRAVKLRGCMFSMRIWELTLRSPILFIQELAGIIAGLSFGKFFLSQMLHGTVFTYIYHKSKPNGNIPYMEHLGIIPKPEWFFGACFKVIPYQSPPCGVAKKNVFFRYEICTDLWFVEWNS